MTAPLIEIRNLTKTYTVGGTPLGRLFGKGPQRLDAVADVSFDILPGEIFSLVGESGSGKTTLGRTLLRLVEPTSGEVRFRGRDLLALRPADMTAARREIQMIFQDPYSSLNPRMSAGAMLREVLHVHDIARGAAVEARVRELLSLVGLPPDAADRYPARFSGGQRQRLGIARALAVEPAFIVADEPVSAVDVSVQAQIMNLLIDLRDRLGLTMLLITHDLSVVRYVSTRVGVMYLGRIVESAPRDRLFAAPRHPYTQALLRAAPRPDPTRRSRETALPGEPPSPLDPPPGCAFHTRCPLADARCRAEAPVLQDLGGHRIACHHHERAAAMAEA
jgi:oligopeptide/dipeptide ABC transporter ATP-binding protein